MTADSAARPASQPLAGVPQHALSFDLEAVHVMEREADSWAWRGAARYDSADLPARLAILRRRIDGLDGPGAAAVALIIPDDQVLFTSIAVDPDLPRRDAVARGLDGLTPYAVEDLDFDWVDEAPDRVKVAAVWRETLDEAEAFATAHGFSPVQALADPDGAYLMRPALFGGVDENEGLAAQQQPSGSCGTLQPQAVNKGFAEQWAASLVDDESRLESDSTGLNATRLPQDAEAIPVLSPDIIAGGDEMRAHRTDLPVAGDEKSALDPASASDTKGAAAGLAELPVPGLTTGTAAALDHAVAETAAQDARHEEDAQAAPAQAKASQPSPPEIDAPAEDAILTNESPAHRRRAGTLEETLHRIRTISKDAPAGVNLPHVLPDEPVPGQPSPQQPEPDKPEPALPEPDAPAAQAVGPMAAAQAAGPEKPLDTSPAPILAPQGTEPSDVGGAVTASAAEDAPSGGASLAAMTPSAGAATLDPPRLAGGASSGGTSGPAQPLAAPQRAQPAPRRAGWTRRIADKAARPNPAEAAGLRKTISAAASRARLAAMTAVRASKEKARPAAAPVAATADPAATQVVSHHAVVASTTRPKAAPALKPLPQPADPRARAFHQRAKQGRDDAAPPAATPRRSPVSARASEGHGGFYLMLALLVMSLLGVFLITPNEVPVTATPQASAETQASRVTAQQGTSDVAAEVAPVASVATPTDQTGSALPEGAAPAATATIAGGPLPPSSVAQAPLAGATSATAPGATPEPVSAAVDGTADDAAQAGSQATSAAQSTTAPPAVPAATAPPASAAESTRAAIDSAVAQAVATNAGEQSAGTVIPAAGAAPKPATGVIAPDERDAPSAPARPAAADASPPRPQNPLPFEEASQAAPQTVTGTRPRSRPAPAAAAAPRSAPQPSAASDASAAPPAAPASTVSQSIQPVRPTGASRPPDRPASPVRPTGTATPAPSSAQSSSAPRPPAVRRGAGLAAPSPIRIASAGGVMDWGPAVLQAWQTNPAPAAEGRGALRIGIATDQAFGYRALPADGPRLAQNRPPRRDDTVVVVPPAGTAATPARRASAVDAALAEASARTAPDAAAPSSKGRPSRRPATGGATTAVDSAIAAAIEQSPATPGGVALTALTSSPFPERAPRRGGQSDNDAAEEDSTAVAVAAAAASRAGVPALDPATPASPPAGDAAEAARRAERLRLDEALQQQAEARIRARAATDAKIDAQQRAQAEARARAQAAAEAQAAAARRQPVVPAESDNEPDAAGPVGGGVSSGTVANTATLRGMDLNRTTLIGVIGAGPASRGLIRLRNGKIVTVRLGDKIDGGPITSIGNGAVTYVKGGRPYQLKMLDGR